MRRFPENAIAAAVDEADRRGKAGFVHPNRGDDVLAAVNGGVDLIAQTTPHSGPADQATVNAIIERRVALTPILTLWQSFLQPRSRRLMRKAGMDFRQILASLATVPARAGV